MGKDKIPFPVGMIEGDSERIRFAWGVQSLPWLILTDQEHIVREEGFMLSELDAKIKNITGPSEDAAQREGAGAAARALKAPDTT